MKYLQCFLNRENRKFLFCKINHVTVAIIIKCLRCIPFIITAKAGESVISSAFVLIASKSAEHWMKCHMQYSFAQDTCSRCVESLPL